MKQPNIFSFATSELSQDAFICWLLSWASPEHKNTDSSLSDCAVRLIENLFSKHQIEAPKNIQTIKINRQDNNIDITCIINNKHIILIEDKTDTKNHSDQLVRYLEDIKNRHPDKNVVPIYFKTGDQSDYWPVTSQGYKVFHRDDFLEILNLYNGQNSIINDYKDYLQSISDNIEKYKVSPVNQWGWHAWIGFYIRLQKELGTGSWDYVANPSGGFLGFWWHVYNGKLDEDKKFNIYLQLEQHKLIFKLSMDKDEHRKEIRTYYRGKLYSLAQKENISIRQYGRLGAAMGVAILNEDYRITDENGLINISKTIVNLRRIESLIDLLSKEIVN